MTLRAISEADKPVPLIEQTGDELDGARVDAALFFPDGIKQLRTGWEVANAAIDASRFSKPSPAATPVKH